MAQWPKSQKARSHASKPRRPGEGGEANSAAGVEKSPEELWVKQWMVECQTLLAPGQFDPVKAGRLKLEFDALIQFIQRDKATEDKEFFDWLERNVPKLSGNKGRPNWMNQMRL